MVTLLLHVDHRISVWDYSERQDLRYFIEAHTFPGSVDVENFKADFVRAAADWQGVCGVKFRAVDTKEESLFQVKHLSQGAGKSAGVSGDVYAVAFMPFINPGDRTIEVYPALWNPANQCPIVGILRHELGHVLGLFHEFAPLCGKEMKYFNENGVQPTRVGSRNSKSVMSYPWVEEGSGEKSPNWEMKITDQDALEAALLYGPPLSKLTFVKK